MMPLWSMPVILRPCPLLFEALVGAYMIAFASSKIGFAATQCSFIWTRGGFTLSRCLCGNLFLWCGGLSRVCSLRESSVPCTRATICLPSFLVQSQWRVSLTTYSIIDCKKILGCHSVALVKFADGRWYWCSICLRVRVWKQDGLW